MTQRRRASSLTARGLGGGVTAVAQLAWSRWLTARGSAERGDVPGWVLVTMMTAGLVAGLWAVAGDALNTLFRDAVTGVSGP
jgi:hypothetical protein